MAGCSSCGVGVPVEGDRCVECERLGWTAADFGREHADLERDLDDEDAPYIPPDTRATVPPPPGDHPKLAGEQDILGRFRSEVRRCGVVGEETTAATVYLALTSRLLDKPVSAAVKGHSSSGKSFTVETVTKFFPPEAYIEMTAMSEKALIYRKDDYRHRTIVLYEAVALREGVEENLTSYFIRSLLSEGRIEYPVTVRDKDGNWTTKTIVKEGPTNLIFTTTRTRVHDENETRILSLATDDSREQTRRVLLALADESNGGIDLRGWQELQAWLQAQDNRVTIPYSRTLAEMVPPVAVRLRRDFGAILALIRAHAILHQLNRDRDGFGRIVATLEDYEAVRSLVADRISEGVGSTVSPATRETVEAVVALADQHLDGVPATAVAERLGLDKSAARRRLLAARDYVRNEEHRRGQPGRWAVGDPMPDEVELLPPRHLLGDRDTGETAGQPADPSPGGTVASESGGIEEDGLPLEDDGEIRQDGYEGLPEPRVQELVAAAGNSLSTAYRAAARVVPGIVSLRDLTEAQAEAVLRQLREEEATS